MSQKLARIALIGQPNSGKSTFFNAAAGFRAHTSNLPGTTVKVAESPVAVGEERLILVDLPGTYSLLPGDPAEAEVLRYLSENPPDGLIVVLDASLLARGLELLLEVAELGLPTVVVLNMMDELPKKGLRVDPEALSRELGVPVVPACAVRGVGVKEALIEALRAVRQGIVPRRPRFSKHTEDALSLLGGHTREAIWAIEGLGGEVDPKALARARELLAQAHGTSPEEVIALERHHLAMKLAEEVSEFTKPKRGFLDLLDGLLTHPVSGYFFLALFFVLVFSAVFWFGSAVEGLVVEPMEGLGESLFGGLRGLWGELARSVWDGVVGGLGIFLPYLLPLTFFIALAEDLGYLPRVAHLVDVVMHRIGLHGKAVIPFILGYGCTVPAIVATRIMESRRDRVLSAMLLPLIPCGARLAVVFAVVAFFMGPWWALGVLAFDLVLVAIVGAILARVLPGAAPGTVMEIPPLRLPSPKIVLIKTWLSLREFVLVAWPLLLLGSLVMGLAEWAGVSALLDVGLKPLTSWVLGLPEALGTPLVFGFLRKELALVMATTALGVGPSEINQALSPIQMLTYTLFVLLYVPCLATSITIWRELDLKTAALSAALGVGLATLVGGLVHLVGVII